MSPGTLALWVVLPYVAFTVFALGLVWRYRADRPGWNARSSQLHERRLLRWGGPLFHGGMLLTVLGHAGGLLVPAGATRALGVADGTYHAVAFGMGGLAGTAALAGLAILGYRRLTVPTVRGGGAPGDAVVFALLPATVAVGLGLTLFGGGHDYRGTLAPWLRSVLLLRPDGELMAGAPAGFQVHTLLALLLIACWPFTRLVHAFTAPVGYLIRPYIVYRSRGPAPMAGRHHAMSRSRRESPHA